MSAAGKIPVTLVTKPLEGLADEPQTAIVRLPANSGHGHADGTYCVACAGQTDVRAHLFNLLESVRQGLRPPISSVIVDASAVADTERVIAALSGRLPAQALRDHTVARSFSFATTT